MISITQKTFKRVSESYDELYEYNEIKKDMQIS